jgi:hypothetical protein
MRLHIILATLTEFGNGLALATTAKPHRLFDRWIRAVDLAVARQ